MNKRKKRTLKKEWLWITQRGDDLTLALACWFVSDEEVRQALMAATPKTLPVIQY